MPVARNGQRHLLVQDQFAPWFNRAVMAHESFIAPPLEITIYVFAGANLTHEATQFTGKFPVGSVPSGLRYLFECWLQKPVFRSIGVKNIVSNMKEMLLAWWLGVLRMAIETAILLPPAADACLMPDACCLLQMGGDRPQGRLMLDKDEQAGGGGRGA